ncbi:MAG: MATE family efflux transporter [Firmicutes bacterium]|nr:MATE family efflux transporter [Bacillota bacterium]
MGVMPIGKLVVTMSIPMMISMLVQAMYNIVDSVFVAQVSENALTAVSLAFPIQNLMIAVAIGTGVGVNALLSKSLGEKNFFMSNKAANSALLLAFLSWILFVIIGLTVTRPFFVMQTNVTEIVDYGYQYLVICSVLSIFVFQEIAVERLLQSTGKAMLFMIVQAVGAVTNIICDPILIFGLGPFPRMEVAGAAIATVFGQFVGMVVGFVLNEKYNKEVTLKFSEIIKPYPPAIKRIYLVGVPSIIMASVGSVMVFGMNKILIAFNTTATAVFGVYFKLQSFFFMPVFGLNNGLVPIIAYNYGAKRGDRMKEAVIVGMKLAFGIMAVGTAIFMLFPKFLLKMFNASDNMIAIGIPCLRIISIVFVFAAIAIVAGSTFQAVGNGFMSMWVSVLRQLVILLPAAFLLSRLGNVDLVWWSYPIAEIGSLVLSLIFLSKIVKEKMDPLDPTGNMGLLPKR